MPLVDLEVLVGDGLGLAVLLVDADPLVDAGPAGADDTGGTAVRIRCAAQVGWGDCVDSDPVPDDFVGACPDGAVDDLIGVGDAVGGAVDDVVGVGPDDAAGGAVGGVALPVRGGAPVVL